MQPSQPPTGIVPGLRLAQSPWGVRDTCMPTQILRFASGKTVNGPISAMHRVLFKAGWGFDSPFMLTTKYGLKLHLPKTLPKRVLSTFKADLLETISRRDIASLHVKRDTPESRLLMDSGAFLQPLVALYSKLSGEDRITLQNIVTHGIWANTDLVDSGYDVDPVCSDCQSGLDSIFHRCFSCSAVETRARCALGSTLFDYIISQGEDSLMANRCLFPAPPMSSAPSPHTVYETVGFSDGDFFCSADGDIYGDGSCTHPSARAGFGCVQIRPDGSLLKGIFGCVPSSLPQTSLAGEYSALSCAFDNASLCTYVGDCQDVISGFTSGMNHALNSFSPHACTWRHVMHRYSDWQDRIVAAVKVKAHMAEPDPGCAQDVFLKYWGNYHADLLAKQGVALHAPSPADIKTFKASKSDVTNMAVHMIDTLGALRPSRIQGATKAEYLPRFSKPVISHSYSSPHDFRWQGTIWVCNRCLSRTSSLSSCLAGSPCRRKAPLACLGRKNLGHKLWVASAAGGGTIVYCSHCWCYASAYPRNLLRPCSRPRLGRRPCAKLHLVNRRHPVRRSRLRRPFRLHVR